MTGSTTGAAVARTSELLRPYVPRLVVDWLRQAPEATVREVDGSLAFVDISGFTKLTERLARHGKVGAEEMSDTLDATFSALLAEAYDEGAGLVKWGGDAVLLLFDGPDHAPRACRAAHRMRARMREVGRLESTAGRVTLRMSVGIHSGCFHFFLVGDPEHHRELLVSGPGASRTAELEAVASAGQIAVSSETAALLRPRDVGAAVEGGFLLRARPELPVVGIAPPKDVRGLDLASVVPAAIREQVLNQAGDAEHRTIAVAFVQFSGTDAFLEREGPEALADALDAVVRNVQEAAAAHGVTFFETDINRDGGKIMLTAGAPRSLGHEEDRMLRSARLVLDRLGELPVRIGVNRGAVFSGDFGPPFRRTYSVKGDAVNLAARVMGKAQPGQLLATRAVVERSQSVFQTEALPPFMVKGKSQPVEALSVGLLEGAREAARTLAPLLGRAREMAVLDAALEDVRLGRGRLVDLVGEPGIGKSRLVQELRSHATDWVTVVATCEEYESATPYFPFRTLLREVLAIPVGADPGQVLERLRHRVEADAAPLVPWLPLVGVPMDVALPDSPETARLDPRFRKARTEEVVADLLEVVLPTPTLLVVDDVHFMDPASADLLTHLAGRLGSASWLLLTTRREEAGGFHPAPETAVEVRPGPLDADATLVLVGAGTFDAPLPPHEMELLAKRSGGNPLFLRALLEAARTEGSIEGTPDSLEDLITSQIDRLPPEERSVLRYASVLGVSFSEAQVRSLLEGGRIPAGRETLRRLSYFLRAEGHGRYRFQHELIRDAAYDGLPFRRRRVLHARVGETVELSTEDPEEQSELLSLHFFAAGALDKAWHYSRVAGSRAAAKYAYAEAAELLGRAVESARALPHLDPVDVAQALEDLGDARFRLGVFADARRAFAQARHQDPGDPVRTADLLRKEAEVAQRLNQLTLALRTSTRALTVLSGQSTPRAVAARSRIEGFYALVREHQGRYRDAVEWGRRAEADAQTSGDPRALADAYNSLSSTTALAGLGQDRPYGRLALDLYRELGDRAEQSKALNNLAVLEWFEGRGRDALGMFEEAERAAEEAGDTVGAAASRFNVGDVLVRQGQVQEAERVLGGLLPLLRALGSEDFRAATVRALGLARVVEGDPAGARVLLQEARDTFERLGHAAEVAETDASLAEVLLAEGDPDAAAELAADAERRAGALSATYLLPTLQRVRGAGLLESGRVEDAADCLREALHSCETQGGIERGFVLSELARALATLGRTDEAEQCAAEAEEDMDLLGLVASARYPRATA